MNYGPTPESARPAERPRVIRTMRTDVSEFLKSTTPSLITLLAEQARWGQRPAPEAAGRPSGVKWLLFAALGGIVIAGGLVAALLLGATKSAPPTPAATPPPSFIFAEATSELSTENTRSGLLKVLAGAQRSVDPIGTFRRLIIRFPGPNGSTINPSPQELFSLLGAAPPPGLVENTITPPELFVYRQHSGPRVSLMLEVRNPARALQSLFTWEPSLQRDLELLFLGQAPAGSLRSYQDRTYRNIDYRYLRLDPERDQGLGYLYFPAKRLIIIATSEEALQLSVKRLLEAR